MSEAEHYLIKYIAHSLFLDVLEIIVLRNLKVFYGITDTVSLQLKKRGAIWIIMNTFQKPAFVMVWGFIIAISAHY